MGIVKYKPTSSGRRFQTISDFSDITATSDFTSSFGRGTPFTLASLVVLDGLIEEVWVHRSSKNCIHQLHLANLSVLQISYLRHRH